MTRQRCGKWMSLVGLLGCAWRLEGAIVVTGDVADRMIRKDNSRFDGLTNRLGAGTSGTAAAQGSRAAVYVFQLPPPGAGESAVVASAGFQFTIVADLADGTYGIDLYGLPVRATSSVVSGDNYYGKWESGHGTQIQQTIVPPAHPDNGVEAVNTSADGSEKLVTYLNTQYGADGSGTGKYVFLRLNPDASPSPEDTGVDVAFADNDTGKPQLTITFAPVPEAGVMAWASLAAIMALRTRSRRSRLR